MNWKLTLTVIIAVLTALLDTIFTVDTKRTVDELAMKQAEWENSGLVIEEITNMSMVDKYDMLCLS